ncbi:MAG: DUF4339 domain-containing protein [Muribaculaceae bacterium]|nr:DUF4339 domain-containing protein [Muribaculaceae bacterium]
METLYYYQHNGEQKGPVPVDRLVASGIRPGTYVWCKGMQDWQKAEDVAEIRAAMTGHLADKARRHIEIETPEVTEVRGSGTAQEAPQEEKRAFGFPIREDNTMEPDVNMPPQLSMTLSVLTLILCFPPTGVVSVVFTAKSQKAWQNSCMEPDHKTQEELRRKSHEYARLAKMWLGFTISLGIIFWSLVFFIK